MNLMTYDRSERQIEELNKNVRPLIKSGFLGRLYHTTYMSPDDEYSDEQPVCLAKGLSKLRTLKIEVPVRGYKGSTVITPRIVFAQLSNSDLLGATNYYVKVVYPRDNIIELFNAEYLPAQVTLFGQNNKETTKVESKPSKTRTK